MFVDHLPAQVQARGAARDRLSQRGGALDVRRQAHADIRGGRGRPAASARSSARKPRATRSCVAGSYDIHARVADMNANGTLSSHVLPHAARFCRRTVPQGPGQGADARARAGLQRLALREWCGAYPGRFIPLAIVPLWDTTLAVQEIKRMARKGARAVCLPEIPSNFGLPSIHRSYWDPVFKACVDENLVVAIHIGSGGTFRFPSPDTPLDFANTLVNLAVADAAASTCCSRRCCASFPISRSRCPKAASAGCRS